MVSETAVAVAHSVRERDVWHFMCSTVTLFLSHFSMAPEGPHLVEMFGDILYVQQENHMILLSTSYHLE